MRTSLAQVRSRSASAELTPGPPDQPGRVSARYAPVTHSSELTNWIVRPPVAEALRKLTVASDSNYPLLQFVDDGIVVAWPGKVRARPSE